MFSLNVIIGFWLCVCYVQGNPMQISNGLDNDRFNLDLLVEGLKEYQIEVRVLRALKQLQLNGGLEGQAGEKKLHPDLGLNVKQLIKKNGYPIETHVVTTSDGYILEIHRIPHGKSNSEEKDKPVVLVMSGFFCSSADWIISGPEKGLGYILADSGYDVWLANPRGTTWSENHVTLDPKSKEFWDFSYHEMGTSDLPATIDYILNETSQPNMFYIGHSQGTTSYFVLTSEFPEYNEKIRLMTALAPVSYTENIKNPFIRISVLFLNLIMELAETLKITHILSHSPVITLLGQILCSDGAFITQDFCPLILFLATGFDEPQFNKTNMPVLFSNFPSGASLKQVWHYGQGIKTGTFRKYDYGTEINLEKYGQEIPPDYDLKKISSPVAAFYSTNDWISSDVDVRHLISELPNVALDHLVEYKKFNHMDYMWAIDAPTFVYDYVLDLMKNY